MPLTEAHVLNLHASATAKGNWVEPLAQAFIQGVRPVCLGLQHICRAFAQVPIPKATRSNPNILVYTPHELTYVASAELERRLTLRGSTQLPLTGAHVLNHHASATAKGNWVEPLAQAFIQGVRPVCLGLQHICRAFTQCHRQRQLGRTLSTSIHSRGSTCLPWTATHL